MTYLDELFQGNLGISFTYFPFPVTEVMAKALPWSIMLIGITQVLAFVVGVLLGAYAAWRRNTMFDSVVSIGSTFIGNLQSFWIGLLILLVFAYELGWFPASGGFGYTTKGWNWEYIADVAAHAFLPALTLDGDRADRLHPRACATPWSRRSARTTSGSLRRRVCPSGPCP